MQPTLAPAPHPSMQTSAQVSSFLSRFVIKIHLSHPQQARPPPPPPQPPHMQPTTPVARDQNNIDPAISGGAMLAGPQTPQPDLSGQESPKTYGKRPLSTSKRAAQNRAAQRAFRQRKEAHIRDLEGKVKAYETMGEAIKALQAENYQLREYIINLQSRLLDTQGEVPELPGNIDLSQPRGDIPVPAPPTSGTSTSAVPVPPPTAPQQPQPAQNQASAPNDDMNSLNRIAVAGLGMRKPPTEEANYLGNSFQQQARRVRPDDGQPDASELTLPKQEPTHGLPLIS
ncbi:bZIP transcription factor [Aspergillus clavatus NRRL 1]|uniref:bZIP transcription factor n=1 Tax=Aspergillus clavatus (strain ATCC 1007 / CBS 513.65 / DSM 816 / NCTC 3887 / NRRL 1 / QM 1276 / 107) TaxID=344612 RepID=UPI0000EA44B0|nr:bZIP transcription factor, putative [Aspergillus clavatus NRRL 1]EAW13549.1 bZIP transcription factor, putative [Aspergillus clavatus NRRL 1]